MNNLFKEYIIVLFNSVPHYLYELLIILLGLGGILLLATYGFKKGIIFCSRLLLSEYVVWTYSSTVFYRREIESRSFDLHPFLSYASVLEGNIWILPEKGMNLFVFIPIGFLVGLSFKLIKWWQVMMVGCFISMSIETMQFIFKRGYLALDDVINNTVGCIIGFGLFLSYNKLMYVFRNR